MQDQFTVILRGLALSAVQVSKSCSFPLIRPLSFSYNDSSDRLKICNIFWVEMISVISVGVTELILDLESWGDDYFFFVLLCFLYMWNIRIYAPCINNINTRNQCLVGWWPDNGMVRCFVQVMRWSWRLVIIVIKRQLHARPIYCPSPTASIVGCTGVKIMFISSHTTTFVLIERLKWST